MMLAILLAASFTGCGSERAAVKNLRDRPQLSEPQPATVEQLLAIRPPWWRKRAGRRRVERTVVAVDVEVLAFKEEHDGDLHVVIRGGRGAVMVAEFPSVECTVGSPYAVQMQRARLRMGELARAGVSHIRLTGVIFFDKVHGQIGGAKNGVELHPVIDARPTERRNGKE